MGKFSKDLDEDLAKKVTNMALEMGLQAMGIDIKPILLKKSKKEVGLVLKGNDLTELFTGSDSIVAIALYQKAFEEVDEETQNLWIESLLNQVSYDMEKDKIVITKPELNIGIGTYRKYGNIAVQKAELAVLTVQGIIEREKEEKLAAKSLKIKK
jgi:hypothetical protein